MKKVNQTMCKIIFISITYYLQKNIFIVVRCMKEKIINKRQIIGLIIPNCIILDNLSILTPFINVCFKLIARIKIKLFYSHEGVAKSVSL